MRNAIRLPLQIVMVASCVLASVSAASAQQRFPLSLDLSFGGFRSWSNGVYSNDASGAIAADATVALRVKPVWNGTLVAGVSAHMQGHMYADVCDLLSDGSCRPGYPLWSGGTLLMGWETSGAGLRLLTGPAFTRGDINGDSRWTLAWQGRMDIVPFSRGPVALVGSMRGTLVPTYKRSTFGLLAWGVGLRIGH